MESLDGVSFDVASRHVSRTILSSVGGFSQSARQNIRTLQDLLGTIQRFNLELFDSHALQRGTHIGEGVSYKVSECRSTASGTAYARKDVKLPPKGGDTRIFERQVACVLRDVEVMHGLSDRPNILDIIGYGWDIDSGNVIPFLVTELAVEGTLRQFLKHNDLALHEKLLLCKDVAHGLHSLHVVGIAHGDLKLDNVLIKPYIGEGGRRDQERLRVTGMQACISDFGHSLHLYDNEEDTAVTQRYGGTLAYNAPEILDRSRASRADLNFRKCDIWSLGLTCWEVIRDGKAYYHSAAVEHSILSSQKQSSSLPSPPTTNPSSQSSTAALLEELITVTPQLASISCKEISEKTEGLLDPSDVNRLHYVFRRCLEPEPADRIADIPLLPLFYGQGASSTPASRIQIRSGTSWSFELFELAQRYPNEFRKLIANDWEKMASEPGNSIVPARAAFQLGLAYASGFGVDQDPGQALHWFGESVSKGFQQAEMYLPVLRSIDRKSFFTSHDDHLKKYLESNRAAFRTLFSSLLPTDAESTGDENDIVQEPWLESLVDQFDDPDTWMSYKETPLTVALKLGNWAVTNKLLGRGASVKIIDSANCRPLHWLFMLPDDQITDSIGCELRGLKSASAPAVYPEPMQPSLVVDSGLELVPAPVDYLAPIQQSLIADPQLPIVLGGSALAFAVTVHCTTAVQVLLSLNADPLLGQDVPPHKIQMRSPICIAFRLHMADILGMLLEHIVDHMEKDHVIKVLDGLQECNASIPLERALVHGPYVELAAQKTVNVLWNCYSHVGRAPKLWNLLRTAARSCDTMLCSVIMSCIGGSNITRLEPEELNELMYTCMYAACEVDRDLALSTKIIQFAVDNGCDINCCPATDKMPLYIVADRKRADLLYWMIEHHDIDLASYDVDGHTVLHRIVLSGFLDAFDVNKLIAKGADPRIRDYESKTAVDLFRIGQVVGNLRDLLIYAPPQTKENIMRKAIQANAPDVLVACVDSYEIGTEDTKDRPYLQKTLDALFSPDFENIRASIQDSYTTLQYALSLAASTASRKIIKILIDAGASPTAPDDNGLVFIHKVTDFGNVDALRFCLEAGYNMNEESLLGSPLVIAAKALAKSAQQRPGLSSCCHTLLDAGADPNCTDRRGRTALTVLLRAYLAYGGREFELIEKLLQHGAHPQDGDIDLDGHLLPMLIAREELGLASLLITYGISPHDVSVDGDSPLHLCVLIEDEDDMDDVHQVVQQLLDAGANPVCENRNGVTALELSILKDNGPITFMFINHLCMDLTITDWAPSFPEFSWIRSHFIQRPPNRLRERQSLPNMAIVPLPSTKPLSTILHQAWGLAVFSNKYSSICALIQAGYPGPYTYLSRRTAVILLCYAMAREYDIVLRAFMGGLDPATNAYEEPDPYLHTIWTSLHPYFDIEHHHTYYADLPTILAHGAPEPRYAIGMIPLDPDVPEQLLFHSFHRLQYMAAIGSYQARFPASQLVYEGFVEAQMEGGFMEVVVDEEAEKRKMQHLALQSVLGPIGDEELAYVHVGGGRVGGVSDVSVAWG